jgi:hypothetical protein
MKKILGLATIAVFALTSCDKVGELDIDIPLNQEITYDIVVPVGVYDTMFTDVNSIDANKELADYLDKIKEFNITSVKYSFSNLTGGAGGDGSDALLGGEYKLSFLGKLFTNFNFAPSSPITASLSDLVGADEKSIPLADLGNTDALLNVLKAGGELVKEVTASSDNSATEPYTITVTMKIEANVTAGVTE